MTLQQATINEYKRIAKAFYATLDGEPTPAKIAAGLREISVIKQYANSSFVKVRTAVKFDQASKGFTKAVQAIDKIKYSDLKILEAKKKPHVKRVSPEDADALLEAAVESGNDSTVAAIFIAKLTGCRPIELANLRYFGNGKLFIQGAKKDEIKVPTADGKEISWRGADRQLIFDEEYWDELKNAVDILRETLYSTDEIQLDKNIEALRKRVAVVAAKAFPDRRSKKVKARKGAPTLYSFRNQMASDLKRMHKHIPDVMSRELMSWIMGHQSTYSISKYGDPRNGSGGSLPFVTDIPESDLKKRVRTPIKGSKRYLQTKPVNPELDKVNRNSPDN